MKSTFSHPLASSPEVFIRCKMQEARTLEVVINYLIKTRSPFPQSTIATLQEMSERINDDLNQV